MTPPNLIPDTAKVVIDNDPSHAARLMPDVEILVLDEMIVTNNEDLDFLMVDASGRKHCVSMTHNLLQKLAKFVEPKQIPVFKEEEV